VFALAAVAFAVGVIVGVGHGGSPAMDLAGSYASAWTKRDYATMYGALDPGSRGSLSAASFAGLNAGALATATVTAARVAGHPRRDGGNTVAVPIALSTRLYGPLKLDLLMEVVEAGGDEHVRWSHSLLFPGLRPGERLSSRTILPQRAALLARDGSALAEGPSGPAVASSSGEASRLTAAGEAAGAVVGTVGPPPATRRTALEAEGVPANGLVGLSGLELAFDSALRGTPGGELLAGTRVLGAAVPHPGADVRTTISPTLQRAAVAALGGQYGGIVVLRPHTGEVLAVAGIGLDGLQPPGSTFKMVTLAGVLSAGVARPSTVFPYATYSTLDGVRLSNANGEECGGTLETAFAVSCNSVFAPLGVRLGAARLVQTAQAFGFNAPTGIPGAPSSTLPEASAIQGELALGSTAIGQGQVLATPLAMAVVASTIADGGRRPVPTMLAGTRPTYAASAVSRAVADTERRLMIGVVRSGTGTAAAIPGVVVAGKTGTAELKTRSACGAESTSGEGSREPCQGSESEASNTDAWFAAFAPALHPRIAVCVLLVKDGAGGATAAPVAREVLEAALHGGA
jgi:cell division protein FtsI/penicillin-binding protein 2